MPHQSQLAFKLLTRLAESEDPLGMNASASADSSSSVMSESSAFLSPERQQQLLNGDDQSNNDNDENNGYHILLLQPNLKLSEQLDHVYVNRRRTLRRNQQS